MSSPQDMFFWAIVRDMKVPPGIDPTFVCTSKMYYRSFKAAYDAGLRVSDDHAALRYCDTYVEVVGCTREMIVANNELHLIEKE